jgi:hypothetical protein
MPYKDSLFSVSVYIEAIEDKQKITQQRMTQKQH